jgi:cytochrome c oxidase subunit 2
VNSMQLLPESASAFASELDLFFWLMVAVCGAVATAIAAFVIYSAIRYHRTRENELPPQIQGDLRLEAAWTITPLIIFIGMFGWGAKLYFEIERAPNDAIDVWVVGKQWMWKVQYADGQREINSLHVPVGQAVKLTMTSQDAIHSFFIPAFRIKQDVLPGRYTEIWFRATKPGQYHLFCAEYCGAKHSGMIGWVYAMEPAEYRNWQQQGAAEGSLASTGEKLFHQFACANCHHFDDQNQCPNLRNLYGRQVLLASGDTVIADAPYIRESVLDPKAKVVAGFEPIMPTFQGMLTEDQIIALIAYIRSLGPPPGGETPSSSGSAPRTLGAKGIGAAGSTSINQSVPGKK